jgi:carboxyl-terminal processing protease
VHAFDESVGIVKITTFDDTAPTQFCEAVDSLLAAGCDKFVFDVRYNLGGSLDSVRGVLSYFLNEGDPIIHTCDRNGKYVTTTVGVAEYVTEEDIGKYAGLNAVVLCNERTASAAELFTANFRDYEMGTIVGVKTYGKGSMQSLYSLDAYGVSGGLKLTTKMYYPPSGEGYDGIGIIPDVEVALDDTLLDKSVFEIKDDEDNQLRVALEYFK